MNSFIASVENIFADHLALTGKEAHHCARVLRMAEGEELIAIDGVGCAYRAKIISIARERVDCSIEERLPEMNEPACNLTLGVSLLKHSAKFDIVVEKAVELGVRTIIPMIATRCERKRGNTERWRDIAASATKQSLRSRIPLIAEPRSIAETCAAQPFGAIAIAHEKTPAEHSFAKFLVSLYIAQRNSLLVLIGPEGGFTEDECLQAESFGATRVSLGSIRLRVETAAILCAGLALHS